MQGYKPVETIMASLSRHIIAGCDDRGKPHYNYIYEEIYRLVRENELLKKREEDERRRLFEQIRSMLVQIAPDMAQKLEYEIANNRLKKAEALLSKSV